MEAMAHLVGRFIYIKNAHVHCENSQRLNYPMSPGYLSDR